jgi:hypothetical protein
MGELDHDTLSYSIDSSRARRAAWCTGPLSKTLQHDSMVRLSQQGRESGGGDEVPARGVSCELDAVQIDIQPSSGFELVIGFIVVLLNFYL